MQKIRKFHGFLRFFYLLFKNCGVKYKHEWSGHRQNRIHQKKNPRL